jgi:hypothetical protein
MLNFIYSRQLILNNFPSPENGKKKKRKKNASRESEVEGCVKVLQTKISIPQIIGCTRHSQNKFASALTCTIILPEAKRGVEIFF